MFNKKLGIDYIIGGAMQSTPSLKYGSIETDEQGGWILHTTDKTRVFSIWFQRWGLTILA